MQEPPALPDHRAHRVIEGQRVPPDRKALLATQEVPLELLVLQVLRAPLVSLDFREDWDQLEPQALEEPQVYRELQEVPLAPLAGRAPPVPLGPEEPLVLPEFRVPLVVQARREIPGVPQGPLVLVPVVPLVPLDRWD